MSYRSIEPFIYLRGFDIYGLFRPIRSTNDSLNFVFKTQHHQVIRPIRGTFTDLSISKLNFQTLDNK